MARRCKYHCRPCGGHFTSLEAFDSHREAPTSGNRECTFPDGSGLVELTGTCEIGDPVTPQINVTIYESAGASRVREHFKSQQAA